MTYDKYNVSKPVPTEIVVGKYSGKQASNVLAQASAGVGYKIIDSYGRGDNLETIAMFRRACDRPRPPHLELVMDKFKIENYEKEFGIDKKEVVII